MLVGGTCDSIIIQNPNTPTDALKQLEKYCSWLDCMVFTQHPHITDEILERMLQCLAKSYYDTERIYVARHPRTPASCLEHLSKDRDSRVRKDALRRLTKDGRSFE